MIKIYLSVVIATILFIFTRVAHKETFEIKENKDNNNKNLFFIISKKVTQNMYDKYSNLNLGDIVFISDQKPEIERKNIFYISDDISFKNGFYGMRDKIKITSWDKVFYYLKNNSKKYDYYWFIEDDVYLNKNNMDKFLKDYSNNTSDALFFGWHKIFSKGDNWAHWKSNRNIFNKNELSAAITQIIRISDKVCDHILNFQKNNNRFIFHEILFASIVKKHNLSYQIIKNDKHHITSVKESSLIYNKFNNEEAKLLDYADKKMTVIHPFKNWYDY